MSRSVNTVSDAVVVVYLEYEGFDEYEWEDFVEYGIRARIVSRFPSFRSVDKWDGREERRILENEHAKVVVCEYCGLVSVNLAVDLADHFYSSQPLAEWWCSQIANSFAELFPKRLRLVCRASNGECVYEKVRKQ